MNKPCPFCGGKPNIYYESDGVGYVNCANEFGTEDYSCTGISLSSTIDEWNTRPIEESLQSKLAKEHKLSDALYLLLVDDPNTKLKADQIMVNIFGKCEPSESEVSTTPDVLIDIKNDDTCPDCSGSGQVAGAYFSEDGITTCDRCNGKGTI